MTKNAAFSPEEVRAIRRAWESGQTARSIAQAYGCAAETVARIGRRETYVHVEDLVREKGTDAEASLARLLGELEGKEEGE